MAGSVLPDCSRLFSHCSGFRFALKTSKHKNNDGQRSSKPPALRFSLGATPSDPVPQRRGGGGGEKGRERGEREGGEREGGERENLWYPTSLHKQTNNKNGSSGISKSPAPPHSRRPLSIHPTPFSSPPRSSRAPSSPDTSSRRVWSSRGSRRPGPPCRSTAWRWWAACGATSCAADPSARRSEPVSTTLETSPTPRACSLPACTCTATPRHA